MDLSKAIPYEPIWMNAHVPDEDDDEDYISDEAILERRQRDSDAYWHGPMAVYDPD